MSWVEPVTLAGEHVRLEPAGEEHLADLVVAGAGPDRLGAPAVAAAARPRRDARAARGRAARRAPVRPDRGGQRPRGRRSRPTATSTSATVRSRSAAPGSGARGGARRSTPRRSCSSSATRSRRCARNRVAIKTDIRNERSQAAIARLGAVREGVLRHQMIRPDGSLRDTVMFSIDPGGVAGACGEHLRARLAAHRVTSATARP